MDREGLYIYNTLGGASAFEITLNKSSGYPQIDHTVADIERYKDKDQALVINILFA